MPESDEFLDMSESETAHDAAVEAFLERVREADIEGVNRLFLFGSVARDTPRPDSDIDILAILDETVDEAALEERLRDIAYDVMLEYGTVFSVHAVSETTLEARADHPFFQTVLSEGRAIYG